jgi:hypothetical protein
VATHSNSGFGDMSDPVAVVECMGQKKYTKIMKKQLNPVFDEVVVFEFRDIYPVCTYAYALLRY